ncbi:hypothetical protein BRE01_06350 [Brevibacillus reuszeri]|uniref:SWIM zinc finger family protein n=1 Tax=Brevibacillus reuszeri TaxID=54915 RepID=A0A0K9YQ63_9BACL|nr:hypothetical protein [Brevibacillus reuszeri]KNB70848.1 SWIM zinc finger family protein [Brevibacillus reuszeri]MED1857239.1 hypothetical protein [Brevibacillus reuszeri]GED66933.1 hypothetical protein BRE01_06350 [Brevibacillus reuszeri]
MAEFKTEFHRFIALCNEEYLIQYANKGIYNRALKDMEKGVTVSYEFGEDYVECALSDDSVCRLHADISRFSCSCPSDKMCKHVIIAIVYYANQYLTVDTTEEVAGFQPDFGWVLDLAPAQISKAFSAAQIEEVLFRLEYDEDIEIAMTSFLTVTLPSQKVIVTFEPDSEIAKTMCSCKAKGNCIHKLEALLRYRLANQIDDSAALLTTNLDVSFDQDVVRETKELIQEVLGIGLAKLSNTICTRLELLAIAAHNGNLPNLESELRGLHGDLSLFFKRHVQFSKEGLLDRLTRVYVGLVALERAVHSDQKKQLLGSFKSRYYTIPQLTLYALGANPWETRSGYKGVTYYFFSLDDKRIYTYTEARPVYYEGSSFSYLNSYKGKTPWSDLLTMEELAQSQVVLTQPKTNREQRLSSSEDTQLGIQARLHIEEIELGDTFIRDWAEVTKRKSGDLFEQSTDTVFLLRAAKASNVEFDDATQKLSITIEHEDCHTIDLTITYQEKFARTLNALERNKRLLELRDVFVLVQRIGDTFVPISFLQGTSLTSIKLDL